MFLILLQTQTMLGHFINGGLKKSTKSYIRSVFLDETKYIYFKKIFLTILSNPKTIFLRLFLLERL